VSDRLGYSAETWKRKVLGGVKVIDAEVCGICEFLPRTQGLYHDTIRHMMQNIEFSEEELFETICEEGAMQGIADEPAYFDLVDEIIEDLRRESELDDDQNLQGHADHLKTRFSEYVARIAD
jgi:hypothetical protein